MRVFLVAVLVLLVGCTTGEQVINPLTGIKSPLVLAYNDVGDSVQHSQEIQFEPGEVLAATALETRGVLPEGTVSFCCGTEEECWGYQFGEEFECTERAVTPTTAVTGRVKVFCYNAGRRKCLVGFR